MKKYLLTLIFIPYFVIAQPGLIPKTDPIESEFHLFKNNNSYHGYFIYKISYKNLVFEKAGDVFTAGYKVSIEVKNDLKGEIYREYNQHTVLVEEFNQTTAENVYLEGYIDFRIDSGSYNFTSVFNDINSNREYKLKPIWFSTETSANIIGSPIVIKSEEQFCEDSNFISLANYSSDIPFNNNNYSLLIPVFDNSVDSLFLELVNNDKTILNGLLEESFVTKFEIKECDRNYGFLKNREGDGTKYFILRDISNKLMEGSALIRIKTNTHSDVKKEFELKVRWINKPRSLFDPEKSIEYLVLIENSTDVENLNKVSKKNLSNELNRFWKKYDPSPETTFNELMDEFYRRVDYAEMNFRALANHNGAKSDRGKTYVRYGSPDSIDRFTDEYGRMMEIWDYSDPVLKFMFIDKKGNGNFTIINN